MDAYSIGGNRMPSELLGAVVGCYLGANFEYDLGAVCKAWNSLMQLPAYTVHTTLTLSDYTFTRLLKHRGEESGSSGSTIVTEGTNEGDSGGVSAKYSGEWRRILKRLSVHRGNVIIQSCLLKGKNGGLAAEWAAYVDVVLCVLEHLKAVKSLTFHDASLGSSVEDFLLQANYDESVIRKTPPYSFLDLDCQSMSREFEDNLCSCIEKHYSVRAYTVSPSIMLKALAERLLSVIASSVQGLERLSLRGKVVEAALSMYCHAYDLGHIRPLIFPRGVYVAVPVATLSFLLFPKLECLHVLRAHEVYALCSFLSTHRNCLKCITVNLHKTSEESVHESSYAFWSCLSALGYKDNMNRSSKSRGCNLVLESLISLNLQITHEGEAIKFLDYITCPSLKSLKVSIVGGVQSSNNILTSCAVFLNFLKRNGKLLESLHLDAKLFDFVLTKDRSLLPSVVLPNLQTAKLSASFFSQFLSTENVTPKLCSLNISRMNPETETHRMSRRYSLLNKDVIAIVNQRKSIKNLVLPFHKGHYEKLEHVSRLKLAGWGLNDRMVIFKNLPNLEIVIFSFCCVTWPYLAEFLSASSKLKQLVLSGGVIECYSDVQIPPYVVENLEVVESLSSEVIFDKFASLGFIKKKATLQGQMKLVKPDNGITGMGLCGLKDSEISQPKIEESEDFDELLPRHWRY